MANFSYHPSKSRTVTDSSVRNAILCQSCQMYWYIETAEKCPKCGSKNQKLVESEVTNNEEK